MEMIREKPNPRKHADKEVVDDVLEEYGLITKQQKNKKQKERIK